MSDSIIVVNGLTKRFKKFSVENVSFEVTRGKMHAIIGSSGSGKTVTIKSLVGGIRFDAGSITINGFKAGTSKAKEQLGYVPEFNKFPSKITVYSFLKSLSKISGLKGANLKARLKELMDEFSLWEFRDKNVNSFSSGMKKKVMIIQGIIHDPDVLILDEPEANLDVTNRKMVLAFLKKISENGKTIFFSSHLLNEIKDVIDECSIIFKGKLLYSGSVNYFGLKNLFILESEDNEAILQYFAMNNITAYYENDNKNVVFKLNNILEINKLFLYTIENNMIIYSLKQYEVDLNYFYKNFKKEK